MKTYNCTIKMTSTSYHFRILNFVIAFFLTSLIAKGNSNSNPIEYIWKPLKVGAGGWVVGMYIHPSKPNLMYIRTDVAGAYRWDSVHKMWKQIVTEQSIPTKYVKYANYAGVYSLVGSSDRPNIAYMAFRNQIFKSIDFGENWLSTSFEKHNINMDENGVGRQEGERLAVDPHNSDIVYYGSINDGLWVTYNAGQKWTRIESIPFGEKKHGVNTVIFDQNSGVTKKGTNVIYVTVDKGGVFRSSDSGKTWIRISDNGPGTNRRYRDADISSDGTYYVVSSNQDTESCVWKYLKNKWVDITPGGGKQPYCNIATDPTNANRIVVMKDGRGSYSSEDQGDKWIIHDTFKLISPTIDWLGKQETGWLSSGEIVFDPFESGKLWFAEGFGVWWTKNLKSKEIVWTEQAAGIEQTCGNAVICPQNGKPISAMCDIGAFYHQNPDSYNAIRAYNYFLSCWSLDWCPADPNFIVGVFHTHHAYNNKPTSSYSTDGGKTWIPFEFQTNDHAYGCIAVSANSKDNIVRLSANNKLPYYTTNRGKSWNQCSIPQISNSGYTFLYSPSKPICADRVSPSTFYFYQLNKGVFRSVDAGVNWNKISDGPVLRRYNSMLKATPGYAKDIWFAEGKENRVVGGLWHSTNGGEIWEKITGLEQVFSFGFGKSKDDNGYPTIFVAGVNNGDYGLYRSIDEGKSWDKIGAYPLGILYVGHGIKLAG